MKFELFQPVKWTVTQKFGENLSPLYKQLGMLGHNGIDYCYLVNYQNMTEGQPIYACHDGIAFTEEDDSAGKGIVIRTNDKFDYNGQQVYFKSIYWHLKGYAIQNGTQIKAGDLIGYADNTGASSGSHLHFGIKPTSQNESDWIWYNVDQNNGYNGAIDPTPYFNSFYAEDSQKVFIILQSEISLLKKVVNYFTKK